MLAPLLVAIAAAVIPADEALPGGGGGGGRRNDVAELGGDSGNLSDAAGPRPSGLRPIPCQEPSDCGQNVLQGAYCDLEYMMCSCKPDYPVTDSLNCYKVANFNGFCRLDIQCQHTDKNTRCNPDLNMCQCLPRYKPQRSGKEKWCMEDLSTSDSSEDSYYDPALFGIMGALALMFIIMCVVLQLFARAQFRDQNRSIFNTPNPRLMNVSVMKNNNKVSRTGSGIEDAAATGAAESAFGGARRKATGASTRRGHPEDPGGGGGGAAARASTSIEIRDTET